MNWHARLVLGILIGGTYLLGGCTSEQRANDIYVTGWVGPTTAARKKQETVKPLYCYRTLGAPECYSEAQKGCEDRLIGFYTPAPKPLPPVPAQKSVKKRRPFYCCPPQD